MSHLYKGSYYRGALGKYSGYLGAANATARLVSKLTKMAGKPKWQKTLGKDWKPSGPKYKRGKQMAKNMDVRLNKRVGGYQGLELKFIDSKYVQGNNVFPPLWGDTNANNTSRADGEGDLIGKITTGTGPSQKIGRYAILHSIQVNGVLRIDSYLFGLSSEIVPFRARVIFYCDKQTNATQADPSKVMDSASDDVDAFRNIEFQDRFKVIFDKTVTFNPKIERSESGATWLSSAQEVPFSFKRSLHDKKVAYTTGDDGAVATVIDNSIHCACIGAADDGTTNHALKLKWKAKLRFWG